MTQLIFVYLGEEYPLREIADSEAEAEAARLNLQYEESGGMVIVKRTECSDALDLEPFRMLRV